MIFEVVPVPRPRMTQRDRWKKRPAVLRYHSYRDQIRILSNGAPLPERLGLRFYIPMPKSWSKKKRAEMRGKPHQNKPDLDNLIKGFLDCWDEDKHVWCIRAEKFWHTHGEVWIEPA